MFINNIMILHLHDPFHVFADAVSDASKASELNSHNIKAFLRKG
jgi:hypothetical protein